MNQTIEKHSDTELAIVTTTVVPIADIKAQRDEALQAIAGIEANRTQVNADLDGQIVPLQATVDDCDAKLARAEVLGITDVAPDAIVTDLTPTP